MGARAPCQDHRLRHIPAAAELEHGGPAEWPFLPKSVRILVKIGPDKEG